MKLRAKLVLALCILMGCFTAIALCAHFGATPRISPERQRAVIGGLSGHDYLRETSRDPDDTEEPETVDRDDVGGRAGPQGCRYERFEEGIQLVWQRPTTGSVRGVAFLAHGCSHSCIDFCPKDALLCPKCRPLPEERRVVESFMGRGYLILAISSKNRASKCWSSKEDILRVNRTMHALLTRENLGPSIPYMRLALFGASSGGSFVTEFAKALHQENGGKMGWQSLHVVSQVAVPSAAFVRYVISSGWCPPLVISTMVRDVRMYKTALATAVSLQRIRACEKKVWHRPLTSLNLTTRFFHERAGLSLQDSRAIYDALLSDESISLSGALKHDPRQNPSWRTSIRKVLGKRHPLGADRSAIAEEMNVAFGFHEMSAEGLEGTLDYLKV